MLATPSRQAVLRALAAASLAFEHRASQASTPSLEVPLQLCGGAYCVGYSVDGQLFRAVVDTGSPFLAVDGTCSASSGPGRWGCYRGTPQSAGLADNELSFAGQDVIVQWRRGDFELTGPDQASTLRVPDAVFGIVRASRGSFGSSAIFFGLVKAGGPRLGRYPTLLEQTDIQSLRFDFLKRRMTLSRAPLIDQAAAAVPIVDLRPRPVNAPDLKYAARVERVLINGRVLPLDAPAVAIIDTGTTGLTLSEELYEARPELYAERAASVRIELQDEQGGLQALEASVRRRRPDAAGIPSVDVDLASPEFDEFPLVVSSVPIRWGTGKRGTPYVLFVGLAFLWQRQVTIDVDARRMMVV